MTDRPFVSSASGTEARREPRRLVSWRGQLLTADGRRLAVRIVDISATGAGLAGEDKLQQQQAVLLEAEVPRLPRMDGHSVERWRATVAYQTFAGDVLRSGLKFEGPTVEQQELLRAWVAHRGNMW